MSDDGDNRKPSGWMFGEGAYLTKDYDGDRYFIGHDTITKLDAQENALLNVTLLGQDTSIEIVTEHVTEPVDGFHWVTLN